MKLYATITSERASKGQGGKHLDILVKNEAGEPVLSVNVTPTFYRVSAYITDRPRTVFEGFLPQKGKRQKDEEMCKNPIHATPCPANCEACKVDCKEHNR